MSTTAPQGVKTEKAFCWFAEDKQLIFGTLCSVSLDVLREARRRDPGVIGALDVIEPEAAALVAARHCGELNLEFPTGWQLQASRWPSHDQLSEFCYFYFEVKHRLKFKHPRGGRMPKEILWLLSGWLQRGELPSYCNYQRYCQLEGLKLLPLLIDHDYFRFFVFRPTVERVEAAVETFKLAVKVMTGPGSYDLPWLATRLLVSLRDDELWPIRFERQDPKLLVNRRRLSFVYRDLKGSQDAVRFTPD